MLTAELVRPRLRKRGNELHVELLESDDLHWRQTAADLIALFCQHAGCTLAAWEHALERYEGERLDYVVIRGMAKVLQDEATFTPTQTLLPPLQIREQLFAYGPVFSQPQLFQPQAREEVLRECADRLGLTSEQLEQGMFADRPASYLLTDTGLTWTPESLIARYNLELARGVLYWASHVQIEVHSGYKDLWKYIKLFKLMSWVRPLHDGGYIVDLDGPISPFVRATLRYGRQFAAFLPALLLCERWSMAAAVHAPQMGNMLRYHLDATSNLSTHFKQSGPFDSRLEADFAREFAEKFGDKRSQWLLTREDEVLPVGDTVMIPDFALTHNKSGQRILIEIVGFWHPDYLRRKIAKVRAAHCHNLLLLVYEAVNISTEALRDVPGEVLYFKQKPVLKEVMQTVERMASRSIG